MAEKPAKQEREGSDREELTKIAYEAQVYQQQAQALQQQLAAIQTSTSEIETVLETLRAMGEIKDNQVLVPVGAGVQLRGKIVDKENVLYGIGAGVVLEKGVGEAIGALTERRTHLENARGEIEGGLTALGDRLQKLDSEARKLVARMRESGVQPSKE